MQGAELIVCESIDRQLDWSLGDNQHTAHEKGTKFHECAVEEIGDVIVVDTERSNNMEIHPIQVHLQDGNGMYGRLDGLDHKAVQLVVGQVEKEHQKKDAYGSGEDSLVVFEGEVAVVAGRQLLPGFCFWRLNHGRLHGVGVPSQSGEERLELIGLSFGILSWELGVWCVGRGVSRHGRAVLVHIDGTIDDIGYRGFAGGM